MRLSSILATIILSAFPIVLAAQIDEPGDAPQLVGKVEGNVYVSPTGLFRMPIPVLPELGGNITDTENVVTFEDVFTTHISIGVFPMDASQRWDLSTSNKKDYLLKFFSSLVLADFRKQFPGAIMESEKFLPNVNNGALLVYILLPGGSRFNERIALFDDDDKLPTAKRGNLLFVRNDQVFILSSEIAERATERSQYTLKTAEEDEILRLRLLGVLSQIRFTGTAAAQK